MQSLNFWASAVADVARGLRHMAQLGTSPLQGIVTPQKKKKRRGQNYHYFTLRFYSSFFGDYRETLGDAVSKGEDLAPTNCPNGFSTVMVFLHLCTTSVITFLYFDGIKFIFCPFFFLEAIMKPPLWSQSS